MNAIYRFLHNLTRPAPLEEFSDYDDYWKTRQSHGSTPLFQRFRYIAERIPDNSTVLDIGCGDGAFLKYLKTTKPSCRLLGADVSSSAVDSLRNEGIDCTLIKHDLPLRSQIKDQFEYVVLMEVIEHVQDSERLVQDAASVARKRLFITIPNVGFLTHRVRLALFGRFPITSIYHHMKEHIRFWTVRDFREWAAHLDLNIAIESPQLNRTDSPFSVYLKTLWPALFAPGMIYGIDIKS